VTYVIAYDISDDRRRDRLANALLDFGARIQHSVFLAHLDLDLASRMKQKIEVLLVPEDRCHVFPLCGACQERTWVFGAAELPRDEDFYIV